MIYIIGKSGYLGASLLDYFGDEAVGLGRNDEVPLCSSKDTIVNCAGYGWRPGEEDILEAITTNVLLTIQLYELCKEANHIYFASGMQKERPEHLYSATKNLACKYLKGKAHILTLYTIYGGKHDPPYRFMGTFLKAAKYGKPYVITTPDSTRDFVHIDRLCKTVEELTKTKDYKEIDFGCGKARSLMDVYEYVKCNFRDRSKDMNLANIKFQYPESQRYAYCAKKPYLPDYFEEDIKKEWERI